MEKLELNLDQTSLHLGQIASKLAAERSFKRTLFPSLFFSPNEWQSRSCLQTQTLTIALETLSTLLLLCSSLSPICSLAHFNAPCLFPHVRAR